MDKLADNLRYYRKSKKYTQEEIANKLDISTSAYGFYEQGRNDRKSCGYEKISLCG